MLYTDHVELVYGYLKACGVRDAEDLTSEVFIGMLRGLSSFRGGPADFRSWLMTITYRRMVDDRRRRQTDRSSPTEPAELISLRTDRPKEPLPHRIDRRLIDAFSSLTTEQREVLALRFVADLDLRTVAEITERPVGAVKAMQHRGLQSLRDALADGGVTREEMMR